MSKIEEIRKRHRDDTECHQITQPSKDVAQLHADRATLLAALDGEWQSERPMEGAWWVAIHPGKRNPKHPAVMQATIKPPFCHTGHGTLTIDGRKLAGALWQRRTVPKDPFKGAAR